MNSNVVIVGATRGLGRALAEEYVKRGDTVWGTSREDKPPSDSTSPIAWIQSIDVSTADAGAKIVSGYSGKGPIDILIITAGYFATETFDNPDFEKELLMYKTSAIGPVFVVHHLAKAGLLGQGGKLVLLSSESGSITLRHESEGGGNYGHHASKAALNMVGKLLSLDLKERGVAVAILHPGFMRTEMTKSVGFDQFWDKGGAVTPDIAAKSLADFVKSFDMSKTGQYWAPRGPGDIGTAEDVLGSKDKLQTPLELPW